MKLLTKLILFIFLFSTFTLELPVNAFAQEANKDSIKVITLTDEEIAKFKEELANRSENSMMDDSTKYSRTKRSAVAGAGTLSLGLNERPINPPYQPHTQSVAYNFHGSLKNYSYMGGSYTLKKGDIVNLNWLVTKNSDPTKGAYRYIRCQVN